jgi:hypothetical protein
MEHKEQQMLGKLKGNLSAFKNQAEGPLMQSAINKLAPELTPHLEKITSLEPDTVLNDASYKERFVEPTAMALMATSGGITSMIPGFNERFERSMLLVRDELVIVDEANRSVSLHRDFAIRLPSVLLAGIKLPG